MKRMWIWLLCVALAFSLTACNGCNENTDPVTDPDTSTTDGGDTTDGDESTSTTENGAAATTEGDGSAANGESGSSDGTGNTQAEGSASKAEGTTASTKDSGTSAAKTTGSTQKTQTEITDNVVDWGQVFGNDTTTKTTKKGETTATSSTKKGETTTTTTTTTTQATTTTTVAPTVVNEVKLPAVGTDVDVNKLKGRLRISAIDLKDGIMSITIKNESSNWITEETDWVKYACYDKDGKELTGQGEYFGYIYLGCLEVGESISETVTLPAGTVEVKLIDSKIVYWTEWS